MSESRHGAPHDRARLPRLGGAAVPAALVAISVLLVLIVVLVSSVMGGGRPGVIPLGGAASASVDQGQVLDGQTQAGPGGGASGSPSARASKSSKPSTSPTPPAPAPAPPAFQPVSVEAESAALSSRTSESPYPCAKCSGGSKVRFVGNGNTVTFTGLTVPAAGTYHLTIAYELADEQRSFFVSVNGNSAIEVACTGTSWDTPTTRALAVVLRAGANSIVFGNPGANAPDLDKITVGP